MANIQADFLPNHQLQTPVLFMIFNRIETTKQVFEVIRRAKPPRLYIASDGPREIHPNEAEKVLYVRDYVMKNIDWGCEIKTLFRDKNLGCKYAVSGAINWFFENEEMGIVLEDDCLPSLSFFWFCEELLERYKDDMRVGQISGDNFQNGERRGDADYYFSIYTHIWGWASWSTRWKEYDVNLTSFLNNRFIDTVIYDKKLRKYWKKIFLSMKRQKIDTWDFQWTFTLWKKKQLTILPNVNLIRNIGFGIDATHTVGDSEYANMEIFEIVIYRHPKEVFQNSEGDEVTSRRMISQKKYFAIIVRKLIEIATKLCGAI